MRTQVSLTRAIAAAMLGAGLLVTTAPALSQGAGPGPAAGEQRRFDPERVREMIRMRTERLAARLEIKASQQEAWTAYAKVRESMFNPPANRPGRDADAATVARFRAQMAQQRAQSLAALADATASLQRVLEPAQRKILDEVTRHSGRRGMKGGHHMRGGPGMHEGEPRRWQGPRGEAFPEHGEPAQG